MKLKVEYYDHKYYIVFDEHNKAIGSLTDESEKILNWLELNGLWENGSLVEMALKTPVINQGDMVYHIEDEEKTPYRWKIWDNNERIIKDWDFLEKEGRYIFTIKYPWEWKK